MYECFEIVFIYGVKRVFKKNFFGKKMFEI